VGQGKEEEAQGVCGYVREKKGESIPLRGKGSGNCCSRVTCSSVSSLTGSGVKLIIYLFPEMPKPRACSPKGSNAQRSATHFKIGNCKSMEDIGSVYRVV
jgi:hypothetical protein